MEWADILKEIRSHIHNAPDSNASQKLAKRIIKYASLLFNGDEQLAEKYWEYIAPEEGQSPRVYGMSSEVMVGGGLKVVYFGDCFPVFYRGTVV